MAQEAESVQEEEAQDEEQGAEPKARLLKFAPLPDSQVGKRGGSLRLLAGVKVKVLVELGRSRLPVKEVLDLAPGAIVKLDRPPSDPVDVLINGELVARGEIVVIDNHFGVRITEIIRRDRSFVELNSET